MTTATKICKVCDAEYEYCHTLYRVEGVFRWQDVACCAEHGSIYLSRIQASRAAKPAASKDSGVAQLSAANLLEEDDGDEWFEDDFDDDTDE